MLDLSLEKNDVTKRQIYSLNGIWVCETAKEDEKELVPAKWSHQIQVPSLVDAASPTLPEDYDYVFMKKEFTVDRKSEKSFLKIFKGCYGKKVWVNGVDVGEHHFNYTPAFMDITSFLNKCGETNDVIVRLGKRGKQPDEYHTGNDVEKKFYTPGLFDDVELHLGGNFHVSHIQTAPDLETSTVRILAKIRNYSDSEETITVDFSISEANGGKSVGNDAVSITLEPGAQGEVEKVVSIDNCQLWTPETPFLYVLNVATADDQLDVKFGMRTFHFDPVTKKPMLNGEIYMLRGTNITMYRFFEDPECKLLPWDKEWARKIIRLFKSINMNSARYCIGFPPEIWYEVADEEGFIVQDEYPIWYWEEKATVDRVSEEATSWIYDRCNHPCVTIFDIQNETIDERTSEVVKNVRHLDIQNRPWDNGWSSQLTPTDTNEVHTYFFCGDPHWKVELLKDYGLNDPYQNPDYPIAFNEYGWNWINRDGTPTTLSQSLYDAQLPNATSEERRVFNAELIGMKTEFWRAHRHAIVQHFCGLGHTREGGCTSDNLLPNLENPRFERHFEKAAKNAFAPVGLMIFHYNKIEEAGQGVTIPVYASNDKSEPWSNDVTLKVVKNGKVYEQVTRQFAAVPTGYREGLEFRIKIPEPGEYEMVAEYTECGETVQSIRKFKSMSVQEIHARYGLGFRKNILASSEAQIYPWGNTDKVLDRKPQNAVDGDEKISKWASKHTDNESITIDLSAVRKITNIKLIWDEVEFASEYKIEISLWPGDSH